MVIGGHRWSAVVSGGQRWSAVVSGGQRWSVVVIGGQWCSVVHSTTNGIRLMTENQKQISLTTKPLRVECDGMHDNG